MSSDSGTELSFDPRTWLSGFDDEEPEPQIRPQQPASQAPLKKRSVRPLIAAVAAAGILMAGGAAAYATREASQPISSVDPQP